MPSADYFGTPHYYTLLGYLMLFHEIGLDYTLSAYASEGGNFGLFASHEMMKRLNAKIYDEAKRLGVKWILGGECGHMWRVLHQYMDTMNGPADFLEVPVSPVTGTRLRECALDQDGAHLRVHCRPDPQRQAEARSQPQRPLERHLPRFLQSGARPWGCSKSRATSCSSVCRKFHEMPENTIREQTFCCGSGAGLGTDENLEMRMRGGLPRANAVQVREGKARREPADLHLRDRQGDAADAAGVLGARAWKWRACMNWWATRW